MRAYVCFLWNTGYRNYLPEHVNILAAACRHWDPEAQFICISEVKKGFSSLVTVVPMPKAAKRLGAITAPQGSRFPSSYRRLWCFSPEAAEVLPECIMLLDVDCMLVGDPAPLWAKEEDFVGWRPMSIWGREDRIGGGTWLLHTGTKTGIWEQFIANPARVIQETKELGWTGSDQAILSRFLKGCSTWNQHCGIYGSQDGVFEWDLPPKDAIIVHFNGDDKPWNCPKLWMRAYCRYFGGQHAIQESREKPLQKPIGKDVHEETGETLPRDQRIQEKTEKKTKVITREDKVELIYLLEEKARREKLKSNTVVGFVGPDSGFTHTIKKTKGQWSRTKDKPDLYLPAKLEAAVVSNKRFIVLIGGRGSGKSLGAGNICLIDAQDNLAKTYCLREYQSSIKNSVHSLLKTEIDRLEFKEFEVLQNAISYKGREAFEFAGLSRNVDSIKSAHGFKRFWVEESQSISTESLQTLTPTVRQKPNKGLPGDIGEAIQAPGVSMIFVANPASSEDPFSKRFILPYMDALERDGYYEDDLHLIIVLNYMDNPWFMESGLEAEREWDFNHLPRALYDHIWLGKFNDSVESALIMAEWFDACVDAHKKLGFDARGAKIASHDPSDGGDPKGYAMRHGSVVLDIQEKTDGNVNEGGHWAAQIAINQQVDAYSWDGTGMGAGLAEQNSQDFDGKPIKLSVFVGAEEPDFPDQPYKPALQAPVDRQLTNKEAFKNKRAQYHFLLRDKVYLTYRAIVHHEYADPDDMISFSSDMPLLSKLRAEMCRIPVKPNSNGLNELYTKEEMKRKFKIASPNLAESVMQTLRFIPSYTQQAHIPRPMRMIGS